MSTAEHAPLAPSSAARWVQCGGSVSMCAKYPQAEGDPKAVEGRLAHETVAAFLLNQPPPDGATEEMLDGADMMLDAVLPITKPSSEAPDGLALLVESHVDCSNIHPENWGTPDAWAINRAYRRLYVWDYKFGHRYVDAFENWQMINYACGILKVAGVAREDIDQYTVHLTIVQPRNFHKDGPVRTWTLSVPELHGYGLRLRAAAELAMSEGALCNTGPECRDCTARHACPTLQATGYNAVDMSGDPVPFDLSPEALGRELTRMKAAAELLDARISGLENEALSKCKQGVSVPGWMTEQGSGRERWARPVEEVIALGEMMGVNINKPAALTPKQAIKAGLPEMVVKQYTETPVGEIKLVPSNLRKVFATKE